MEDRGKVNGERNLAKTSFFRPRYFLRAWKERRRQFDNATLTLEECTGGTRMCTPPAIYLYTRAFARRSTNLEASRGGRERLPNLSIFKFNFDHLSSLEHLYKRNLLPNKVNRAHYE